MSCRESRLSSPIKSRISTQKARGEILIVRPFQERRMRSISKEKNEKGFHESFGRTALEYIGEAISGYARYKEIENVLAVSCAEYIMASM